LKFLSRLTAIEKRGKFAAEWIVKLSMKFNFSVEWILTGEGPARIHSEKISRKNRRMDRRSHAR
jgi:hypothetical protein